MLNRDLKHRIEKCIGGSVESCRPVQGGYTPALRLLCRTSKGSLFVKVGATPLTGQFLRREIQVYNRVSGGFMPRLIGWEDHESQPILIIEDLSALYWPPPWDERQLNLVRAQIDVMHGTQVQLESFE